ncbi:MAG: hypothetical protein FWF84_04875, partial [Kiritimatiellaeota bacterium]|nr:hypothetical protein [Kiritimatiellota bacterium]
MITKRFFVLFLFFSFISGNAFLQAESEVVNVRIYASSDNAGYEAWRAMDGDPTTMWHTQFNAPGRTAGFGSGGPAIQISCGYGAGCAAEHGYFHAKAAAKAAETKAAGEEVKPSPVAKNTANNDGHPHRLCVEMEKPCTLKGFKYTPRQAGSNGEVKEYECFVTNTPDEQCAPAAKGILVAGGGTAPVV